MYQILVLPTVCAVGRDCKLDSKSMSSLTTLPVLPSHVLSEHNRGMGISSILTELEGGLDWIRLKCTIIKCNINIMLIKHQVRNGIFLLKTLSTNMTLVNLKDLF